MWRLLRTLFATPLRRTALLTLALAVCWAWWFWGPVLPASRWECSDQLFDHFNLAPDGQTIVHESLIRTISHGPPNRYGSVRIYDAATGRERFSLFADDLKAPGIHGFSPDGSWLVVEDGNKNGRNIRVLSATDGHELACFPGVRQGEDWNSWGVWIIRDNRRLLLRAPAENRAKVWNVALGRVERELPKGAFPDEISPDGSCFATVTTGDRPAITVWDIVRGYQVARTQLPAFGSIALKFSPDGRKLVWVTGARGRDSRTVCAWDYTDGAASPTIVEWNSSRRQNLEFSPDSRHLVLAPANGWDLWDISTTPPRRHDVAPRDLQPWFNSFIGVSSHSVFFLPGDGRLVMADEGRTTVQFVDLDEPDRPVVCRLRYPGEFVYFGASPDGATMVVQLGGMTPIYAPLEQFLNRHLGIPKTVSRHSVIQLFDTHTGAERAVIWQPYGIGMLGFSPDGQTLWTETRIADPNPQVIEGTRVICGWALPTGRPPAWLVVVSVAGLVVSVWDWRRTRQRATLSIPH